MASTRGMSLGRNNSTAKKMSTNVQDAQTRNPREVLLLVLNYLRLKGMNASYEAVFTEGKEKFGLVEPSVGSVRDLGDILGEYLALRAKLAANIDLVKNNQGSGLLRRKITKSMEAMSQLMSDYMLMRELIATGELADEEDSSMETTQKSGNIGRMLATSSLPGNKKISGSSVHDGKINKTGKTGGSSSIISQVVDNMTDALKKRNEQYGANNNSNSSSGSSHGPSQPATRATRKTHRLSINNNNVHSASTTTAATTTTGAAPVVTPKSSLANEMLSERSLNFTFNNSLPALDLDLNTNSINHLNDGEMANLLDSRQNSSFAFDDHNKTNKSLLGVPEVSLGSILDAAATNSFLGNSNISKSLSCFLNGEASLGFDKCLPESSKATSNSTTNNKHEESRTGPKTKKRRIAPANLSKVPFTTGAIVTPVESETSAVMKSSVTSSSTSSKNNNKSEDDSSSPLSAYSRRDRPKRGGRNGRVDVDGVLSSLTY